jgi:hypothetical protein
VTPEILDRLAYYAGRAPSPHNAQGWLLSWDGDRFRIRLDGERQVLRELDTRAREGELACGAAVENLVVAAAAHGLRADVGWRPEAGVVAEVTLAPAAVAGDLDALRRRAVNRSRYRSTPVRRAVLDELRAAARARGFALHVLTEPAAIAAVAELSARAAAIKLGHAPTQRELHGLMRFSPRTAAERRDGLDLELFFTPRLAAAAGAILLRPPILHALGAAGAVARSADGDPVREAPALALLVGDDFARGGACFQALALAATRHGLALQPHSAAVEVGFERPEVREELRAAFGCAPGGEPIALFRLGHPTQVPARRSLRRPRPIAPAHDHYRELTRRNQPVIADGDQAALRRVRVLFAGCGSIGGAPVEPLARLGLEEMVLAEPGAYETNNLNRQAALLRDVGRNKAEVLRDRVHAINPQARVLVEPRGVTADNVDWLVGTTDLVIDGVDVTEDSGIAAKRLLHEEAWRQRRLVIVGLDLAGTQLIHVFDYRDGRTRPFAGRLDGAGERIGATQLLARLIGALDVPRELLGYTEASLRGQAGAAPQLAPTASLFGVLAAWAVLDFAAGRPLRRRVRVDIPGLLAPWHRRVAGQLGRLATLARLKLLLEVKRARGQI